MVAQGRGVKSLTLRMEARGLGACGRVRHVGHGFAIVVVLIACSDVDMPSGSRFGWNVTVKLVNFSTLVASGKILCIS